ISTDRKALSRQRGTCLRDSWRPEGGLVVVELEPLLHGRQPRLALLEGDPVADVLVELPVQALVHLRVNSIPQPGGRESQLSPCCSLLKDPPVRSLTRPQTLISLTRAREGQGAAPAVGAIFPQDPRAIRHPGRPAAAPTFQPSFQSEGKPPVAKHSSAALPCSSSTLEGGRRLSVG
ncbi:hypothetical protein NHX12_000260, partial [Muraenolepis orangiensis]